MAAKKDPYKRIQKRFVQARAGDVQYEDLSPEQREQFQNRFNTLAQTVEGRGIIAQRILGPEAPQERRRALRQKVRENLPSARTSTSTTQETTPPAGPTITNTRLVPTSADIRNMQAGYRAQGAAIDANRRAAAAPTTVTTTSAKKKDSGRIGSGFWSIPKNPVTAFKEMGQGIMTQVDYLNRAYVNPVINLAGQAADVVGGRKGPDKFKPLPTLSKQEIAIDAALTAATAGASLAVKPLVASSGQLLKQAATSLSRRGLVGTGTALSNLSIRQQNLAAIRAVTAMEAQGTQAIRTALAEQGDTFTRFARPAPSGTTRTPPKPSGRMGTPPATNVVKPKTATKATKPKAATNVVKPKAAPKTAAAVVKETSTAPAVTTTPVTRQTIEQAAETYAGSGASKKSFEFPGQGPTRSPGKSFTEEFGEIEMLSTETTPLPAIERPTPAATRRTTNAKELARAKTLERKPVATTKTVKPEKKVTPKPVSVKPLETKVTTKQIEQKTEKYAPGFNKVAGEMEMRSTEVTPLPARRTARSTKNKSSVPAKVDNAMEALEIPASPRSEPALPKPKRASKKATQKKSQPVVAKAEINVAKPTSEELEFARLYPYSSRAQDILARQRNIKPYTPPTAGQMEFPKIEVKTARVEKSASETFNEQLSRVVEQQRAAQKQAFPGFKPRKVTKLPSRSQAENRLEQRGSMLFRMYDEGPGSRARPSGGDFEEVVDIMAGGGTSTTGPTTSVGSRELDEILERTVVQPIQIIKKGEAINPRWTRRTAKSAKGGMPMPTTQSKGVDIFKPTRMPTGTEVGLSSEQRINLSLRQDFPEAKSLREARILLEKETGVPRQLTSGYRGGSPLGASAKRSPRTEVVIKKPIKYEKVPGKGGEVVYKPVAFAEETVPGIETMAGPVPFDELPQRWNVDPKIVETGRKSRKAATLKSQAQQAARLRNRGIQGEALGFSQQQTVADIKEGKAFQRRFDELTNRPSSPRGPIRSKKKGKKK